MFEELEEQQEQTREERIAELWQIATYEEVFVKISEGPYGLISIFDINREEMLISFHNTSTDEMLHAAGLAYRYGIDRGREQGKNEMQLALRRLIGVVA